MSKIKFNRTVRMFCNKLSYKTAACADAMRREGEEVRFCKDCKAWHLYDDRTCTKRRFRTQEAAACGKNKGYKCSCCGHWHRYTEKIKRPQFMKIINRQEIRMLYGKA